MRTITIGTPSFSTLEPFPFVHDCQPEPLARLRKAGVENELNLVPELSLLLSSGTGNGSLVLINRIAASERDWNKVKSRCFSVFEMLF